jgi:hypothetical protein
MYRGDVIIPRTLTITVLLTRFRSGWFKELANRNNVGLSGGAGRSNVAVKIGNRRQDNRTIRRDGSRSGEQT